MYGKGKYTIGICLVQRMSQVCSGWTIDAFVACEVFQKHVSVGVCILRKTGPFIGYIIRPISWVEGGV
jgi:hypothetical protein